MKLRPQVAEAIRALNQANYWVFVITNQPMIGKGILTLEDLKKIHQKMETDLLKSNANIDSIQFCPHFPGGTISPWNTECVCRKPKTGMIEHLCKEFSVDLTRSFVAGDTWRDIQCGQTMNLFTYGVLGGGGFPYTSSSPYMSAKPSLMVNSLWDAVQHRLSQT